MLIWFVLAFLFVLFVVAIILYSNLVTKRQMVEEGWSGIDVQLKRRSNLIPNLVETVKGYASHEQETLDEVIRLRAQIKAMPDGDVKGRGQAEDMLSQALGRVLAVAEVYPDLKASQNFSDLHQSIANSENSIQMARRYYNGAVSGLNVSVESFPSNLIARQFKFDKAEHFEIEDVAERTAPQVQV